jgi:hypothetical protein
MLRPAHAHAQRRLNPPPRHLPGELPANQFGGLVGTVDHLTLTPHDPQNRNNNPDNNHVYIWIEVPAGRFAGKYECAFNTESNQKGSTSQYHVREEQVDLADFPTVGFWDAEVSYAGLGLTQADFQDITNGQLRSAVSNWARDCILVTAYGIVYPRGDGLHDIHMNSGERAGSQHANLSNQDGALVFYHRNADGTPYRRWVFIKFSTQDLPAAS